MHKIRYFEITYFPSTSKVFNITDKTRAFQHMGTLSSTDSDLDSELFI